MNLSKKTLFAFAFMAGSSNAQPPEMANIHEHRQDRNEWGSNLIELHGSGTTNPSKCYWLLMSQIMDEAKEPLRMTYRAVGSSTGIKEFSEPNPLLRNDFGSGDIPISRSIYESLNAEVSSANETAVAHFPILMGAVSFFHSIPGMKNGENPLNLTSCQLAKIFKREIIYWDNAEIKADNPNLNLPHESYPIKVAHRVKGSSSTSAISKVCTSSLSQCVFAFLSPYSKFQSSQYIAHVQLHSYLSILYSTSMKLVQENGLFPW